MAGPPRVTLGYSHPSLRPPTLARCVSYLPAAPATPFATHDSPKKRGRSRRRDERVLCPGGHLRLIPILQTSTLQRPFVLSRSPASLIRAYPASALSLPPPLRTRITRLSSPSLWLVRLAANATRRKIREAIDQRNSLVFGCLYFRLFLFSFICIYAAISGFFFATLRFARECVTAAALAISSHLHRVYVYDYRSLI